MSAEELPERVSAGWERLGSLLVRGAREEPREGGTLVNPPVTRGSTVLFPTIEAMNRGDGRSHAHKAVYGAMGTPIQHELERLIAAIEGGSDAQAVNSGLSACTLPLLAFLSAGDHLLLADSAYGPTRRFADNVLARFGVEITYYPPMATRAEIDALIRPGTRVILAESPGSHTFEVQDVPMLAEAAHAAGALLFLDNTWGIGVFRPFDHGVDLSIQALTKYPGGHSDVIIGAVTVNDPGHWKTLRDAAIQFGQCAGPDDCWLTLRGLRTMGVRLAHQARAALDIALWLKTRPEVARVLHPALPDCPGHEFWKRDFTGACGLFGVELIDGISPAACEAMIDRLTMFGIGASWGGYESLVLPTTGHIRRVTGEGGPKRARFRLHVGLEAVADLKADLARALDGLRAHRSL